MVIVSIPPNGDGGAAPSFQPNMGYNGGQGSAANNPAATPAIGPTGAIKCFGFIVAHGKIKSPQAPGALGQLLKRHHDTLRGIVPCDNIINCRICS
jgi:hypothetical protein